MVLTGFNFVEWAEFHTNGYLNICREFNLPTIILPPTTHIQLPNANLKYLDSKFNWITHQNQTYIFPQMHDKTIYTALQIARKTAEENVVILIRNKHVKMIYAIIKHEEINTDVALF